MRLLLLVLFALARCTLQEEPQRCSWEERTLVDVKSRLRSGRQVRVRFNDGSTKIVDEADVIGMPGGPAALGKISKPPPPQPAPRFTFIAMLAAVNLLVALVLLATSKLQPIEVQDDAPLARLELLRRSLLGCLLCNTLFGLECPRLYRCATRCATWRCFQVLT